MITVVWAALLSPLPSPRLAPHHLSLIISGMTTLREGIVSPLPLISSSQSPALVIWGRPDGNRGWYRWEWCHSSFGGGGLVAKSCPTSCDPVDCSPPGSSIHGISQARILEWVAISFSRGSSQPMDQTHVLCLLHWPANSLLLSHQISPSPLPYPKATCGEGNGTPLQYSGLENPMDGGAWWAAVHGVAKSQTWLSDFTFTFHFYALEKAMAPTPVFLPGESQGWGRTESDRTEVT